MTFIVKAKPGTLPDKVRQQAGIKIGDVLEFKVSGGVVAVLPKLPTADDEYTPEQRSIVDAQLAEGLADIKAGRVYGPFDTHEEMMRSLRSHGKKAEATTRKRTVR
jgi:bifunctional DNA-binding transcriptional regulator/antitoxin component of YhaV-PrlF toxin-antitoxin module